MKDEIYTAQRRRGRRRLVIVTGRSPLVRHFYDRGPLGAHARWALGPQKRLSLEANRRRRAVLTGDPNPPRVDFVEVGPGAELGGWALALWAVLRVLARR